MKRYLIITKDEEVIVESLAFPTTAIYTGFLTFPYAVVKNDPDNSHYDDHYKQLNINIKDIKAFSLLEEKDKANKEK